MQDGWDRPLREFAASLRLDCGLSDGTVASYGEDLRRLRAYLEQHGVTSPEALQADALIGYLRTLYAEGLSTRSIARHLATCRALGTFLARFGYVAENPAELLERPAMWRRLPSTLHKEPTRRLLDAPEPTARLYRRDKALLEFLYATGCRAGEVRSVRVNDLNEALRVVKLTGKGDRQRLVPLGRRAVEEVGRYARELRPHLVREERPTEALFLSERGRPLDRNRVWAIVKGHARRAGLPEASPHTVRHTFATHLLTGGADLRIVQELLGHAQITTTEIYTHIDRARLQSVVQHHHPRG